MFIMSLIESAQEKLSAWRRRHQAFTELMGLDDRSLADIGIHRSQIPALVFGERKTVVSDYEPKPQGIFAAHQSRIAGGLGAHPPM